MSKRFMLDDAGELIDLNNHKFIDYGEECCNLLNELHEENQKCKEYNGILYANHTKTDRKLVKQISELEKENEQLQHDATILIQSNQDYRKENEKLRRCINSIYTIARLEEVD